jgi:hypothetical protein
MSDPTSRLLKTQLTASTGVRGWISGRFRDLTGPTTGGSGKAALMDLIVVALYDSPEPNRKCTHFKPS